MRTSSSNRRSLRSGSIGSISAWFPSRRSTLHQIGGRVSVFAGQLRSLTGTWVAGTYLAAVWVFMGSSAMHVTHGFSVRCCRTGRYCSNWGV